MTNFRLTALQETGLYDLIVNDNAFEMFDTSSNDGGISLLIIFLYNHLLLNCLNEFTHVDLFSLCVH